MARGTLLSWVLVAATAVAAAAQAPHGAALVTDGSRIVLIDPSLGDTVRALNGVSGGYGACFSPDGRRVAFTGYRSGYQYLIFAVDNDGTHQETICSRYTSESDVHLTWCTDGHLYWSENDATGNIYRVNVATKQREIIRTFSLPPAGNGTLPSKIINLSVSADGRRIASMGVNSEGAYVYDLASGGSARLGEGCRGTLSPSGKLATHNTTGHGAYTFHQVCLIHDVDKALSGVTPNAVDSIVVPGAPDANYRFTGHRFSHSSNDIVVYNGEAALGNQCFVSRVSTDEHWLLATAPAGGWVMAFDFWQGDLPSPQVGPRVAVSPPTLTFASSGGAVPAAQSVTVTNTGTGSLGAVAIQGTPAWLSVSGAAAGNTQTLVNRVNLGGLAVGLYTATVTVSGGGAVNSVNYTVTLNVSAAVNAPSDLSASQAGDSTVLLSWTDNSANEARFVLERQPDGGTWAVVAAPAANSSSYADAPLQAGTYHYHLRAVAGADTSVYSNVAQAVVLPRRSIVIESPLGGSVWLAGTTQYVRWTSSNVGDMVVCYSVDQGETWVIVCDNSVAFGSPQYGNFPWVVPALNADSVLLRLYEYSSPSVEAVSGAFAIRPSASTVDRPPARPPQQVLPRRVVDLRGRVVAAPGLPGRGGIGIVRNCGAFALDIGR